VFRSKILVNEEPNKMMDEETAMPMTLEQFTEET
jgi:hypothetical protein